MYMDHMQCRRTTAGYLPENVLVLWGSSQESMCWPEIEKLSTLVVLAGTHKDKTSFEGIRPREHYQEHELGIPSRVHQLLGL